MKIVLVVSLFTAVLAYNDVDNGFDFEGMVKNKTHFKQFLYCYLDKGPCVDDFMIIGKVHTRQATLDFCAECDDTQKHMYHLLIDAMKKDFPKEYREYVTKYDNSQNHFDQLEEEMDKY